MNTATQAVLLPDTGQSKPVRVLEIIAKIGEKIAANDTILIVESDKATLDVPMPTEGVLLEWQVRVGDLVKMGDSLAVFAPQITENSAQKTPIAAAPTMPTPAALAPLPQASVPLPKPDAPLAKMESPTQLPPLASPAVRKLARELGVDLFQHNTIGTGQKGRILDSDVKNWVKNVLQNQSINSSTNHAIFPKVREVNWAEFGEINIQPASRIRQLTAEQMQRAWLNVPQVTQFDQADITELEQFRKDNSSAEKKLSVLAFLIKMVAKTLRKYPAFNSAIDIENKQIIERKYIHIGIAVETPNGLFVPVIRDVEQGGLQELSQKIAELAARARTNKLAPSELQGGCFSISSLGGIGGGHFTPIVNAPEAAILGVGRAVMQPVWQETQFVPRLMLPLALSYDHRLLDGAQAARFIVDLKAQCEDVRRLLL